MANTSESSPRSAWSSRLGFILASAGSAVGLGAIWKFPYMAGTNGGSIFMLPAIGFSITIGLALLIAEMCMGRGAHAGAGLAFRRLAGRAWAPIGFISVATGALVLAFYSVVGGWCAHYLIEALRGNGISDDPAAMRLAFERFSADPIESVAGHVIFLSAAAGIVLAGVEKGIERVGKILMPLLFILTAVLIVRGLMLPGAMEGVRFLFRPDPDAFTGEALLNAMGYAFFSLSVGSGSMMNYGSYLRDDVNIGSSTAWIVFLAVISSILGGLMIMPAVFAFGLAPDAGPGLSFATMPAVFSHLPMGGVFAAAFYACLFVAALTSAISILEMVSQHCVDCWKLTHRQAVLAVSTVLGTIGIFCALSFGPLREAKLFSFTLFEFLDYATSNIGMPIGCAGIGLAAAFAAWPKIRSELTRNAQWPSWSLTLFRLLAGVAAPLLIAIVALKGAGVL